MVRLACFVITYQRPEPLREMLAALFAQSRPPDHVLVVDNGDPVFTKQVVEAFPGKPILHHVLGENRGPAGAAAHALDHLRREDWDWFVWADDDDPPGFPHTYERLLALAARQQGSTLGAVGAVGARFDWDRGRLVRLSDEALDGPVEIDVVGGGHTLMLHRRAVEAVGLPDERLFFGLEEVEYCLRVRQAGLRILIDGELMHDHRRRAGRIGLNLSRSPLPREDRESLWRRYYTTRNYIFMMRQAFQRQDLARREAARAVVRCAAGFARGPRYGLALAALQLRALGDGYRGRMGRTVAPRPKTPGS